MVLPGYLLAAFARNDSYSTEGAIKYFLLGSFSSAILLFGLAYVWGLTGSTRVSDVAAASGGGGGERFDRARPGDGSGPSMTAGVAFKMAAVPFHYWTPDAYQGSPTPRSRAYLLRRAEGRRLRHRPAALRRRLAPSRPIGCRS